MSAAQTVINGKLLSNLAGTKHIPKVGIVDQCGAISSHFVRDIGTSFGLNGEYILHSSLTRRHRLAARTLGFHPRNRVSITLGATKVSSAQPCLQKPDRNEKGPESIVDWVLFHFVDNVLSKKLGQRF